MKVSVVIAILNSHEIFHRQLLHFSKMDLPDDVEFVFVDDGSDPPLNDGVGLRNLTMLATNDHRPWTQPIARNKGVEVARGEYLLCTDIDHILTEDLINTIRTTSFDIVRFKREVAILDEWGNLIQDMDELKRWGFVGKRFRIGPHGNSYAIRKKLFVEFGGSQQRTRYPNRDEQKIKRWTHRLQDTLTLCNNGGRPTIFMFPNGRFCGDKDYNPFGYFHNLTRRTDEGS